MMRTCLPSTFWLTPVIQESTSLESRPSPFFFTKPVHSSTASGWGSATVSPRASM